MKTKHVYLGRFSPFHLGHKLLLQKVVDKYGIENTLVIIGSSNTLNSRTPYTYEQRREIVLKSFPGIEILPLPDAKPDLLYFDGSTNDLWLDSIENIARSRNEGFVFYGGSAEDLAILAERFETKILVDRKNEGGMMSATKVREAIAKGEFDTLKNLVEEDALDLILNNYSKKI